MLGLVKARGGCDPALIQAWLHAGMGGVGWMGQMLGLFWDRNIVICLGGVPIQLSGCNTVQRPGGWSRRTGAG